MPTYTCTTCNQSFGKWKLYRGHCKDTGHQQQSQQAAMATSSSTAQKSSTRGAHTPEDSIASIIERNQAPMDLSALGTALKQQKVSIPGKLADFVKGRPMRFEVKHGRHGQHVIGLQSAHDAKLSKDSKASSGEVTETILLASRLPQESNKTLSTIRTGQQQTQGQLIDGTKSTALSEALMESNVTSYLHDMLDAKLFKSSKSSTGEAAEAISLASRLPQEPNQTLNATKLPDFTLAANPSPIPQMFPPLSLPSGRSASVEMVVEVERVHAIASYLKGMQAIALDCEGVNLGADGELTLLQVAFMDTWAHVTPACRVVLFDVCKLGYGGLQALSDILQAQIPIKIVHDVHQDAAALTAQFGIKLGGVFDTQLAHEAVFGKMLSSMGEVLQKCGLSEHASKDEGRRLMRQAPDIWKRRPLHPSLVPYAALDVALLLDVWEHIAVAPQYKSLNVERILQASQQRCSRPPQDATVRPLVFDKKWNYQMRSYELVCLELSPEELSSHTVHLEVQDSLSTLLALLPVKLREKLGRGNLLQGLPPSHELRDIILDLGQRPRAFFGHRKLVYLNDDPAVKVAQADIEHIQQQLQGKFGPDNRAGIDGCLHRISAMRAKTANIYGLTLRVGRAIFGNTNLITDLLLGTDKSILFLGTPGCGKTTIIREAARMLSEDAHSVVVVDTSNEICGDGLVPHPAVGLARRMMVPNLHEQAGVLIEAVQNHTPDIIVVDEIGRPAEVEAVKTVKERGVRILGSAHGDLRGLVKNSMLNSLVGGTETVTVGDAEARKRKSALGGELSKVRTQRAGTPVFDVIVELMPGCFHQWQVTTDVSKAVDRILAADQFPSQTRTRDASNGRISMELIRA